VGMPEVRGVLAERARPLRDQWQLLTLSAVLIVVVESAVGLLLVHGDSWVARWDLSWERWLAEHRTDMLDALTHGATWAAETVPVLVILTLAVVVAWRWSTFVAAPVFLLVAVGGEKLCYLVISLIVGRDRPPVDTLGETYATASFPSGHIASAVALYGAIALVATAGRSPVMRRGALVVTVIIASAVGFARMYRGFHYPTDVLAGALLGSFWLAVTWTLLLRPEEARAENREVNTW
jgi:membrane-associated phospholipid phosphatase